MIRYLTPFLLSALLLPLFVAPAGAQWRDPVRRPWSGDTLAGKYINRTEGGTCFVYWRGGSYVFINRQGDRARFAFTAPGRLEMIGGDWSPNNVVTVERDRRGRTVLRFDAPGAPTVHWVRMD
jgi:hypothetical protein